MDNTPPSQVDGQCHDLRDYPSIVNPALGCGANSFLTASQRGAGQRCLGSHVKDSIGPADSDDLTRNAATQTPKSLQYLIDDVWRMARTPPYPVQELTTATQVTLKFSWTLTLTSSKVHS
jgi:hypothetical protein